ncbi:MAG: hypothetical protein SVP26_00230 [Chloroflexota bacterium]|nr:hypothetical protein [Chloroflexota bacterium]
MLKNVLAALAIVLVLVAILAAPVLADLGEQPLTATVTVTSYTSVTFADNDAAGLSWGSLTPGAEKQAEAASPSITITAAAENNNDVGVYLKGTDFSDGGTNSFGIANAFYSDTDNSGAASSMPSDYAGSAWKTLAAGQSVNIYHWLTIPDTQAAATYTSTFTYKTQAE